MKSTRSRKALSPVVASIILIAVTVAVSIAVAAWMGALTFNFMSTEQGQISNILFNPGNSSITVYFSNTGTTSITISQIWVNNVQRTTGITPALSNSTACTVQGNSQLLWNVVLSSPVTYVSGYQYSVKLVSNKGTNFPGTGTAPT